MTITPNTNVSKPSRDQINGFRTDMFGRTKVSQNYTFFDAAHRFQENPDYSDIFTGTASKSYSQNESCVNLTIGTASGDKAHRETKKVMLYQPGKSLQLMQTFTMAPAKTNLRQRAGYYSRQNGFYLEQTGTTINLVKRSYTSGAIVETRVPQSEWNMDKLDGSGPSDVVLDLSKSQILWTEVEWLGVGSVKMGFAIDGYFIAAHQFNHANHATSTYITTAALPFAFEIENIGTTSSTSTMKQICCSAAINGGYEKTTESWSAYRSTPVNITTSFTQLVSIRLSHDRTDAIIIPSALDILATQANSYEWVLLRNATITGGTWTTHASPANVDFNVTATGLSGINDAIIVRQGYFQSTNQSSGSIEIGGINRLDLQLGRTNADTPVSDIFTLAIRTLSGSGQAVGSMAWFDLLS